MESAKKNKKKIVIALVISLVAILAIISIFYILISNNQNTTNEQGTTAKQQNVEHENDTSEVLLKDKTFENMKVTNIRLVAENGITTFTAEVINDSDTDFKEKELNIVFTNEDGSIYTVLRGFLPDLKVGESNTIDTSIPQDLSNAYDFTIEELKYIE